MQVPTILQQLIDWETITDEEVAEVKKILCSAVEPVVRLIDPKFHVAKCPQYGDLEEIHLTVHQMDSGQMMKYFIIISYPSGIICMIDRLTEEEYEQIVEKNEIKSLPYEIDGMVLKYDKRPIITIDGEDFPLELITDKIRVDDGDGVMRLPMPRAYIPMYVACVNIAPPVDEDGIGFCIFDDYDLHPELVHSDEDLYCGDDYCTRLRAYDDPEKSIYGLLVSRQYHGHNPCIGLLDSKNKTLELIEYGGNYDYPSILAFHIKNDKNVEVYLHTDKLKSETIYLLENFRPQLTIDNFYGECRWREILKLKNGCSE